MKSKTSKYAVINTAKLLDPGKYRFIPDYSRQIKESADYPFHVMNRGDSFLVPVQADALTIQRRVSAAACNYAKSGAKIKFATRQVKSGVRVWRIK